MSCMSIYVLVKPISDDAGFLYDFLLCHMEINDHVPKCNCVERNYISLPNS
jgi:hypothetical protein